MTQSTNYLDVDNFVNLFQLSIEKVIIVVMMTFVIISGEIDLSVASVMASRAAVLAPLHEAGTVPFGLAIVIALPPAASPGWSRAGASPGSGCRRWSSRSPG